MLGDLQAELAKDRTKSYVVEISPLGLVEMTRQNITRGLREVVTEPCPRCRGDGAVLSEESALIEVERRIRGLSLPRRFRACGWRFTRASPIGSRPRGPPGVPAPVPPRCRPRRGHLGSAPGSRCWG